ncbi:DUF6562 domain-containing protein [Millionella massiliensis]|uniref:DUF6562 domain-containing protein n=1 Tax=Millionella massiliensis TaxID=1871023 RepID=UPI0008D9A5F7|nr:DUF6562 domain-containing protein [Millionella massiliensis]
MKRVIIGTVCLFVLFLTGCKKTILEEPIDGGVDPSLVQMNLTLNIDPSIEYYSSTTKADASDEYDVRWVVEVFRDQIGDTPVERRIVSCDPASDGQHSISTTFSLKAAKYQVVAWMDYVEDGTVDDKYYSVDDLSAIAYPDLENYLGDEEHKDAYVGQKKFDFTVYHDQWNVEVDCDMTLERPLAKIEVITTDVDRFLYNQAMKRAQLSKNGSIQQDEVPQDLAALKVTVDYAGYFPTGFNAYENKPNDAQTGVSFDCPVTQLSESEAHMAGDYVFVNGTESAVTVNLSVRDQSGNLINQVNGINVPVVRGKHTIIRDDFLTKTYTPGIGIDTGFDGVIEVVIPD